MNTSFESPAAAASLLRHWVSEQSAVADAVANIPPDSELWDALDYLADSADADDSERCSAGIKAIFAGLVETLNDSLRADYRRAYSRFFARIIYRVAAQHPDLHQQLTAFGLHTADDLYQRHNQLIHTPADTLTTIPKTAQRIIILSRVTIGADILLSSVVMQRCRQRWPNAEIVLIGQDKLTGLLGGMDNMRVRSLNYSRRGPLAERLRSWLELCAIIADENPDCILAPDSRLDQLGLLPVHAHCPYALWENTMPSADQGGNQALATLVDTWCADILHLPAQPSCVPALFPDANMSAAQQQLQSTFGSKPLLAVKLDHGGNPAKALPRQAEIMLLKNIIKKGWRILIDRGFGDEEYANSDSLLAAINASVLDIDDSGQEEMGIAVSTLTTNQLADTELIRFHGSIAGWAAALSCCAFSVSYDSVGQHLSAALNIPVAVAFAGYSNESFPIAWSPCSQAPVSVTAFYKSQVENPIIWGKFLSTIPAPH